MKKWTAKEIIRARYKGQKNFMTPNILKVGKFNPNVAFELSSGKSIFKDANIYGVTVVAVNKNKWTTRSLDEISKAFTSKNEAEEYINKLKRKLAKNRGR